jgi:D-3-phosphoglycerate dehydrogenase
MDLAGKKRIVIANRNVPRMIEQITAILADEGININDMLNRSKGNNAYNIIDIDSEISENGIGKVRAIGGVTMVRVI